MIPAQEIKEFLAFLAGNSRLSRKRQADFSTLFVTKFLSLENNP